MCPPPLVKTSLRSYAIESHTNYIRIMHISYFCSFFMLEIVFVEKNDYHYNKV